MSAIPSKNPMRGGQLKNGNISGDLAAMPRCGAVTRAGRPCQGVAMPNQRCRMHGGRSTGPRTADGVERLRNARTRHGAYGKEMREVRELIRVLEAQAKRLMELA